MAQQFVESQIKKMLLFEPLPDEQLALVAGAFQVLRFEPGALVYRQGQPAQGMFYFVSGRGVLSRFEQDPTGGASTEVVIGEVGPNEYVGEAALFAQTEENASLRVVDSAIVLFLSRQRLTTLLMNHPELRTNLGRQRGDEHKVVKALFKGQRADEVTLNVYRRHWWSYARFAWIPAGLTIIMVFGSLMFSASPALALGLIGVALLIPALIMGYLYIEWQDDLIIVTNQRVVRLRNVLFGLQNSLTEISLDSVNEVNVVAPPGDPMARMFDYATVTVRTAGNVGTLGMSFVPRAHQLRETVFTHRDQVRRSIQQQQRREIEAEVEKVLGLNTESAPAGTPTPQTGAVQPDAGFSFTPLRMRFIDEQGRKVYRKHWLIWLQHVLVPSIVIIGGATLGAISIFAPLPSLEGLGIIISAGLVGLGLLWFYIADWDWRNDQFILGDDVITLIRRRPLWLQNEVDQVRLNKIDSVVSSVEGILSNVFDMGNVKISLIGSDQAKILTSVYKPAELQADLSQRLARMRQQQQEGDAQRQREAIAEYLAAYHDKVAALTSAQDGTVAMPIQRAGGDTIAREVNPPPTPEEPPPQPIRDAIRPPRVPRVRPE